MRTRNAALALLCLVLALIAACSSATPTPPPPTPVGSTVDVPGGGSYRQVSPLELQGLLAAGDVTLVNVHIPYAGEIEPTALFLPYNEVADRLSELPAKDAGIALYCKSGGMSTEAAQLLAGLGYTRVYELRGGMDAWQAAGLPLKQ